MKRPRRQNVGHALNILRYMRPLVASTFGGDANNRPIAPDVDGHIDRIEPGHVLGWVKQHDHPDPLYIDLYVDGECVERGVFAGNFRADLLEAGIGNGRYAFEIRLPDGVVRAGAAATVEVCRSGDDRPCLLACARPDDGRPAMAPDDGTTAGRAPVNAEPSPAEAPPRPITLATEPEAAAVEPPALAFLPVEYAAKLETVEPNRLKGWAVDTSDPDRLFDVEILVDGVRYTTVRNDTPRTDLARVGKSSGLGGVALTWDLGYLEPGGHQVTMRLPDGTSASLTIDIGAGKRRPPLPPGETSPEGTAVVVPVYNAHDDVAACIERLRAHTSASADILFIDDASPDPRIGALLAEAERSANIRVLRNEANLGFTGTVNRGLAETGRRDVVILNSDARVTPGWLDGMIKAARSGPRIATVTAMSDRAGAFSAPDMGNGNALPPGVEEATFARAFRRRGLGLYPAVPTGNGFCMFVSRACVDEIGHLDAEAFPRGYGEENDFCMRAGRAGWRHILDDCTYVFHAHARSFGGDKTELVAQGREVIDARFPEYTKAIAVFRDAPKLKLARFRARQALDDCADPALTLPRVLFVIATQTGGTPWTNRDLMAALEDALDCCVLRCDSVELTLSRVRDGEAELLRHHRLDEHVDPITHTSAEYDAVVGTWLEELDIDLVHIRHMGWHSLSLPRMAREAGKVVVYSFHDFYTLCPTVKLLDDRNSFCGGDCTATEGPCSAKLWPEGSLPELRDRWVSVWRARFEQAIANCDALVTTSQSARETVLRNLPRLPAERFWVIPHGRDFDRFQRLRSMPEHGEPLRILVPGNIDAAKGREVIYDLAEHDTGGLLEFHVLGDLDHNGRRPPDRVKLHGLYARQSFAAKVAPIRPHLGAVFSIWDETYCHTLTELWSVGLPALVFDFPTVANRVRENGAGWVLPDHRDIPRLYEEILRISFDSAEQACSELALLEWQSGAGAGRTTRMMAGEYLEVYRAARRHGRQRQQKAAESGRDVTRRTADRAATRTPVVAVVCPAERSLTSANASTEVRIWQRTRNALDRAVTYVRMTPAGLLANLRAGRVDGAILQRTAIPVTLVRELLAAFEAAKVPYLFDLDDDLLNVPDEKDPDGVYAQYAPALGDLMARAGTLTVSTPALLASCRPVNGRPVLLPNRLSRALWSGPMEPRSADGVVRVLYMGTPTHQGDFALVKAALGAAAAANPAFRVGIIGVTTEDLPPWAERIDIPAKARTYSRFVPWLRGQVHRFDFAIAPLEETEFNAAKSALKILDYGALGLPVLASDTEVYRDVATVAPNVMRVANQTNTWREVLQQQIDLGPHNAELGAELRCWVFENHMLEPTLPDFDALVRELLTEGT